MTRPKLNRRKFLLVSAVAGGGVLIGYAATRPSRHRRANDTLATGGDRFVTSWIRLQPDNRVTVYVPHAEMGQGVHTSPGDDGGRRTRRRVGTRRRRTGAGDRPVRQRSRGFRFR